MIEKSLDFNTNRQVLHEIDEVWRHQSRELDHPTSSNEWFWFSDSNSWCNNKWRSLGTWNGLFE
jgi:hypothetical protein